MIMNVIILYLVVETLKGTALKYGKECNDEYYLMIIYMIKNELTLIYIYL